MNRLVFENSISLDGYTAGPNDSPDNPLGDGGSRLFDWYQSGDVDFPLPGTDMSFKISQASADLLNEGWSKIGAMICGRRMFDISGAWGGKPPGGGPCFVMTHNPPQEWLNEGSPFTFVSGNINDAVAQAAKIAGDKDISIASASVAQQCIRAKLLDVLLLDVAPVLLGGGVRLFDALEVTPIDLESIAVVAAPNVTHLMYRIIK